VADHDPGCTSEGFLAFAIGMVRLPPQRRAASRGGACSRPTRHHGIGKSHTNAKAERRAGVIGDAFANGRRDDSELPLAVLAAINKAR
jgi:hypothetical protein